MIERYTRPEMGAVWGEAARWEAALHVEIAVAHAQAKRGDIPAAAAQAIATRAKVNLPRIAELEATLDASQSLRRRSITTRSPS